MIKLRKSLLAVGAIVSHSDVTPNYVPFNSALFAGRVNRGPPLGAKFHSADSARSELPPSARERIGFLDAVAKTQSR